MLPRFRHSHSAIRVLLEWIYTGYLLHSFWRSTLLFYGILDGLCIRKNWWLMLWGNRPCYFWPKGLEIHQFLHDRYQYWICDHLYCPCKYFLFLLCFQFAFLFIVYYCNSSNLSPPTPLFNWVLTCQTGATTLSKDKSSGPAFSPWLSA